MTTTPTEATHEPTVADVLRDAATVLRERGLERGNREGPRGYCALGALGIAKGLSAWATEETTPEARTMVRWLGLPLTEPWLPESWALAEWSNGARDAEYVAAHMEKAAAAWEETVGLDD